MDSKTLDTTLKLLSELESLNGVSMEHYKKFSSKFGIPGDRLLVKLLILGVIILLSYFALISDISKPLGSNISDYEVQNKDLSTLQLFASGCIKLLLTPAIASTLIFHLVVANCLTKLVLNDATDSKRLSTLTEILCVLSIEKYGLFDAILNSDESYFSDLMKTLLLLLVLIPVLLFRLVFFKAAREQPVIKFKCCVLGIILFADLARGVLLLVLGDKLISNSTSTSEILTNVVAIYILATLDDHFMELYFDPAGAIKRTLGLYLPEATNMVSINEVVQEIIDETKEEDSQSQVNVADEVQDNQP